MNTESDIVVSLYSALVNSTSTVANATVDLGPYFSVMRREAIFVYTYVNGSTVLVADQLVTIRLEEADSTSTASSTAVTFATVTGSTFTSTGSTVTTGSAVYSAYVPISKRYVRAAFVGAGTAPIIGASAALIIKRRAG